MDLGVEAYRVMKENESRNVQGTWDPNLSSQINERIILEKQRKLWDTLEKESGKSKFKESDEPFK